MLVLVPAARPAFIHGPVLKLTIPTHGATTLSQCQDVTLLLMILYALTCPKLGLAKPTGTRLDNEQVIWLGEAPSPRAHVFRLVQPASVAFYFVIVDAAFDLNLAMSNIIKEDRDDSLA